MPPSPELHIRIGPDDQRTRDLLEQAGIPIYREVLLPTDGTPETSLPWEEELAHLTEWVRAVRQGLDHDPQVRMSFIKLHRTLQNRYGSLEKDYPIDTDAMFAQDVLDVLEESLEAHRKLDARPAYLHKKGDSSSITYKRLAGWLGILTPRHVRTAILYWGLATGIGMRKTHEELQTIEGISSVQKLIVKTQWNLIHRLENRKSKKLGA